MLLEGLSLDGGVGSTNLGVHLEVNHRGWYQGGGGAAILHGQERERQGEIRSKVVGRPQRGTIIRTHVTVSSVVRVWRAGVCCLQDASEVMRKPSVIPVCTIYKYARPLPGDGGG